MKKDLKDKIDFKVRSAYKLLKAIQSKMGHKAFNEYLEKMDLQEQKWILRLLEK